MSAAEVTTTRREFYDNTAPCFLILVYTGFNMTCLPKTKKVLEKVIICNIKPQKAINSINN